MVLCMASPLGFLRGCSFPCQNDVVRSGGPNDRDLAVRETLQPVVQGDSRGIRKNLFSQQGKGPESYGSPVDLLEARRGEAGVKFFPRVKLRARTTRLAQGHFFESA